MWSEPWQHVRRALPLLGILLLEIWLHSLAQGEFNFNELSVLAIDTCWHVLSNYDTCELLVVKCALKLKPLKSRPGKHIWVVYMSVCPLYGQQLTIKLPIKSNQYPKRGSWCAFFVVDTIATTAAEWARGWWIIPDSRAGRPVEVPLSWPAAWRSNCCLGRNAPGYFLERWRV